MDQDNIDASLSSVIDPLLHEADSFPSPEPEQPEPTSIITTTATTTTSDPAPPTANALPDPSIPDASQTPENLEGLDDAPIIDAPIIDAPIGQGEKTSRRKAIVPGSTADFRRREANRLAAERSRSRHAEKVDALGVTVNKLEEENERLRQEIAKLENGGDVVDGTQPDSALGTEAHTDALQPETQDTQHALNTDAPTADSHTDDQGVTAQQESHSRTILAALMSDSGMHESLTDADALEGDSSWLANVHDLLQDSGNESSRLGELADVAAGRPEGPGDAGFESQGGAERSEGGNAADSQEQEPDHIFGYTTAAARAATDSALAVAINAEMEKILRDDLACTKVALAVIDRQLARYRGQAEHVDEDFSTTVPAEFLSSDITALRAKQTAVEERMTEIRTALPTHREELMKARDAKVKEETRLAHIAGELYAIREKGYEKDKEDIGTIIRAIGGFIGGLLSKPKTDEPGQDDLPMAAYSTPAIARRRRGRPPKISAVSHAQALPAPHPGTKEDRNMRQQHQHWPATPSPLDQVHIGDATATGDGSGETDDNVDHARTAEEYILHLQNSGQIEQAFADFLPPAGQMEGIELDHPTDESLTAGGDNAGSSNVDGQPELPPPTSVLSRLKKGPPGSCDVCGRTETTVWRKLVLGGEDHKVCNRKPAF